MVNHQKSRKQPNVQLALLIQELFDEPLTRAGNPTIGTDVLNAILHTITNALSIGQSVYIRGFGTFKVITRTPRPTPNSYLTQTVMASDLTYYKPRQVVIFEPSIPLLAMINPEPQTSKERRTWRRWHAD